MKIRISLLILLIIGTVACHRKICSMVFRPQSCELNTVPMNSNDSITGLERTDSMYMNVLFQGDMMQTCATDFPNLSFGSEAMALVMMPTKWDKPLKSFEITSNQDFNGIPAGQSIKSKLCGFTYYPNYSKISVEEALQPYYENKEGFGGSGFNFMFTERPQIPVHRFTAIITFKDNRKFEITGIETEWK